jgi:hypothetical protein
VTRPGRLPRIHRPVEAGHRAPIGLPAITACQDAHHADAHAGEHNPECSVCIRYTAAAILATTLEHRARQETNA